MEESTLTRHSYKKIRSRTRPSPRKMKCTQAYTRLAVCVVVSWAVGTPESREALATLIAARERLAGITRQLTEANASMHTSGNARRRYETLQKEWQQAFAVFNAATAAYSIAGRSIPQDMENGKPKA